MDTVPHDINSLMEWLSKLHPELPTSQTTPEPWMDEHPFPFPEHVAALLQSRNDPHARLAGMSGEEVRKKLWDKVHAAGYPPLSRLADTLFPLGVSHLSVIRQPSGELASSYISFRQGDIGFHLPSRPEIPLDPGRHPALKAVPGLLEFFECFGGMVPGALPPVPHFTACSRMVTIDSHDPQYEWYDVGEWEGSLVWYWGGSGDAIIFHPDGTPGVWCHVDCGDGRSWRMGMGFPELLEELGRFILKQGEERTRQENAFYY